MMMNAKVAFVHDNFAQHGGAERVAEVIAQALPEADMFSTVTVEQRLSAYVKSRRVRTTWMQGLPALDQLYRHYFLLYPLAVRSLDLADYDIVISSCVGFAKGAIRSPGAVHICYCHTPTRWIWRFEDYSARESFGMFTGLVLRSLLQGIRRVDLRSANQPDYYIANSRAVAERIKRFYGRNAIIINPPVDLHRFRIGSEVEDYLLVVSRLVGYKRIDVAVRACNKLGKRLLIVGDGPDRVRLEAHAGPTVTLLGRRTDAEVADLLSRCKALLFPGEEDFGMVPIEANASGRPVIALGAGGALETVVDGVTGVLYPASTPASLIEGIERFESMQWNAAQLRAHAEQFDVPAFCKQFYDVLQDLTGISFNVAAAA